MRLESNGSLENIVSVVYYIWNSTKPLFPPLWAKDSSQYVPADNVPVATIVHYRSSQGIKNKDFKEYDYKLFPNKEKYGDYDIMDIYSNSARELIGNDPSDIEKLSTFAIPTIAVNTRYDSDKGYGYFKCKTLSGGKTIYQLEAPEGCYKIEMYNTILDKTTGNCSYYGCILNTSYADCCFDGINSKEVVFSALPVVSIFLGPERTSKLCPDSFYYGGVVDSDRKAGLTLKEYRALMEEITCNKIVTVVSDSSGGDVSVVYINTPQNSFYDSKDPLRNLSNIALRNDEWHNSKNCICQAGIKNDSLYDLTTGTLLGNKKSIYSPILNSKKELLDQLRTYCPEHTYMKGDIVQVGKYDYVSVVDNNIDHHPMVSPEWVKKEDFVETFAKTINIFVDPVEGGTTSKAYIIYDSGKQKSFTFVSGYGYGFSLDNGKLSGKVTNGKEELVRGNLDDSNTDYYYEQTESSDGSVVRKFVIPENQWDKILETRKIVICPEVRERGCQIRFLYDNYDNARVSQLYEKDTENMKLSLENYYHYLKEGQSIKLEDNINVSFSLEDIVINDHSADGGGLSDLTPSPESPAKFSLTKLESKYYTVTGMKAKYTYSTGLTEEVDLAFDENEGCYIDSTKSSDVIYTILIQKKKFRCRVYYNSEIWEVDNACLYGYCGMSLSFNFYLIDQSKNWQNVLKEIDVYKPSLSSARVYSRTEKAILNEGDTVKGNIFEQVGVTEDGIKIIRCTVPYKDAKDTFDEQDIKIFINENE